MNFVDNGSFWPINVSDCLDNKGRDTRRPTVLLVILAVDNNSVIISSSFISHEWNILRCAHVTRTNAVLVSARMSAVSAADGEDQRPTPKNIQYLLLSRAVSV